MDELVLSNVHLATNVLGLCVAGTITKPKQMSGGWSEQSAENIAHGKDTKR